MAIVQDQPVISGTQLWTVLFPEQFYYPQALHALADSNYCIHVRCYFHCPDGLYIQGAFYLSVYYMFTASNSLQILHSGSNEL